MKRLDALYFHLPVWVQNMAISAYALYRDKLFRENKFYPEAVELVKKINNASQEEIEAWQLEKLNWIVNYALQNTQFYKEYYGIEKVNFDSFEDFKQLPTINKQLVRDNWDKFQVQVKEKVFSSHTSGTTGSSLQLRISAKTTAISRAGILHDRGLVGYSEKSKLASFIGRKIMNNNRNKPPFWRYNAYSKQLMFSNWHVNDENLTKYIEQYNIFNPKFVNGYPSFLYLFSEFSLRKQLPLHQPKSIFTSSENLLPYQRETIEKAFKVKILDLYGVSEELFAAHQQECGSYHLREELGYLETINGEVYGTTFHNTAMPLIRYEIGDRAEVEVIQCSCGKWGRILKNIEGRKEDFVISKTGKKFGRLDHLFKDTIAIKEAQIVQKTIMDLQINMVLNQHNVDLTPIKKEINAKMGGEFNITFNIVDQIPRSKNGKFRFVISMLDKNVFIS